MKGGLAVGEEGPLAMLCGGGSLPLTVADKVVSKGRPVLLFPLRGAAEGLAVERSRITGFTSARSANFCGSRVRLAAATWCLSGHWCGHRFGMCTLISKD